MKILLKFTLIPIHKFNILGAALCTFIMFGSYSVSADSFDHQNLKWTELLQKHVRVLRHGQASQVDYSGFKEDRMVLKKYLSSLSSVSESQFSGFNKNDQMAFLINIYNAYTIDLILSNYPDIESIRDIGHLFSSPWKKAFIPLFGEKISLDDVEHKRLRAEGRFDDPRVHFAVNCASVGCPPLREEAFVGSRLDQQLDQQALRFLSDATRNRFDEAAGELQVSKIFKWYGGDFEKGYRNIRSIRQFLAGYAEQLAGERADQELIRNEKIDIRFLDYDWRLNEVR